MNVRVFAVWLGVGLSGSFGAECVAQGPRWSDPFRVERDDERRAEDRAYDGIPRRATVEQSGTGKLRFRAPSAGRVWVGNDELERQIISTRVRRGDIVEVDPERDRVKRNEEVIFDRNMERRHAHTVFFQREAGSDDPDRDEDAGGGYDGIPTSASRARSGSGVQRYAATKNGRVWVGDDERERQIVSTQVSKGDVVTVDPAKDQVRLNDEVIYDRDLVRRNEHSIFFRAERGGNDGGSGGGGGGKPPKEPEPEKPGAGRPDKESGQTAGAGHPSQLKGASRVARGTGTLTYTAKDDGEFWVYNPSEKKIVAAGALKKGETVTADPANNSTTCPGGARSFENYIASMAHEVYFRKR